MNRDPQLTGLELFTLKAMVKDKIQELEGSKDGSQDRINFFKRLHKSLSKLK